ncbi:dimethyladenosine transferase [Candidatus Uzinura diaspidicola str. ASNER]|uniref:Ribosomal RNA small subunit methyltransferase A n=1 Tax=Candidatus Uzinura diaspidicola str. ASNER TaxID=1133592 RepID=L7VMN9_9FLAO|nr:dimethyladenosine transferase [Candidatus Uzinura diaspidicola str. ASNER]
MLTVFPKKYLGQHFLHDEKIAKKIVQTLSFIGYSSIVELGPGMGMMSQYLIDRTNDLFVIEIDTESVKYLHKVFPTLKNSIINMDFLQCNPMLSSFALIGNFPYNISSNILFYLLKYRKFIPEVIGMFQTEVAERIRSAAGSKTYGILSVLIQAFYEVESIFTVPNNYFFPHPKVKSSVIRLHRKSGVTKKVDDAVLFKIVKVSFNQRRKKLRNTLKSLNFSESFYKIPILDKRAEQLSVQQFIHLSRQAG